MSFGLQLKNSAGKIVFSSDFAAYHFAGKFTANRLSDPNTPFNYQVNFSCVGRPLIFTEGLDSVGAVARSCTLFMTNLGGNNWTATVSFTGTGSTPATIQVYIFALASDPISSGFGGFIKSASGATMLNLSQRVLKITGAHQTTAKSSSVESIPPPDTLFSGSIVPNYIVCCVPLGASSRSNGPYDYGSYFGLVPYRIASTSVGYRVGPAYGFSPPGVEAYQLFQNQYVLFADRSLYQ